MLTRRTKYVIAQVVALLVFGDFAFSWLRTCSPSEPKQSAECAEKYYGLLNSFSYRAFGYIFDWIEGHHDLVIAAATVAIAYFTLILKRSTDRLSEASDRQFASINRPKIRIKHLHIASGAEDGKMLTFKLVFVNVGVTPALIRSCGVGCYVTGDIRSLPADPHFRGIQSFSPTDSGRVLNTGITMVIDRITDGTTLSAEEWSRIKMRGVKLFCVGFVEYEDSQGGVRKTAFCRVLDTHPASSFRFTRADDPDYEYED